MQGIKHALAYTKSSDVIATALSLLHTLDVPQLVTQVCISNTVTSQTSVGLSNGITAFLIHSV